MRVTADHWLEGVKRELVPGKGSAMPIRRAVVVHFTAGASALSSINYWRTLGGSICAHITIDRDGTVYQSRGFDRTCGHAGVSRWKDPKTGKLFKQLNSCTIGIELANGGDSDLLRKKFSKLPAIRARHRNGGALCNWEDYPMAQTEACKEVVKTLVARYNLDDVVGHDDIAPERKSDPGPAFPMKELRAHCGFGETLPVVHKV